MKTSRAGRDDAHRHDVLIVYCGERDADLETGKRRFDAWLAAGKDCPTYPALIPAICLGEENTGGRVEVLDGLARHVREKYGIPVFQWYTDLFPHYDLPPLKIVAPPYCLGLSNSGHHWIGESFDYYCLTGTGACWKSP